MAGIKRVMSKVAVLINCLCSLLFLLLTVMVRTVPLNVATLPKSMKIIFYYIPHDEEYKEGDIVSDPHFYVCQDGMVAVKDCREMLYHWTDNGLINYNEFSEEVLRIISNVY